MTTFDLVSPIVAALFVVATLTAYVVHHRCKVSQSMTWTIAFFGLLPILVSWIEPAALAMLGALGGQDWLLTTAAALQLLWAGRSYLAFRKHRKELQDAESR